MIKNMNNSKGRFKKNSIPILLFLCSLFINIFFNWTALAGIEEERIVANFIPPKPNGWDEWYRVKPQIMLLKETPGLVYYSWNLEKGPFQVYQNFLIAPDGINKLYYYSMNQTSRERMNAVLVKVDTSPPQAKLFEPENFVKINGLVSIVGSIKDQFLKKAWIEYGQGENPKEYIKIKDLEFKDNIKSDILARWDTHNLNDGTYRLRLTAIDQAGNVSFSTKRVIVDNTAPRTILSTSPSSSSLGNLCFKSLPVMMINRLEPGLTYYQWDKTTGDWNLYVEPFKGKKGFHTLHFYSIDDLGNKEDIQSIKILVDLEPPEIINKIPQPDSNDVKLNNPLIIIFNKAIDTTSLDNEAIIAKAGDSFISGDLRYDPDAFRVIFQPERGWPADSEVQIEISKKILDMAGHSLKNNIKYSFKTTANLDISPPSMPENLQAQAISENEILLNWVKSIDNFGVKAYRVYRGSELVATIEGETKFVDRGLMPKGIYNHQVTAVDYSGNESAKTKPVRTTTPSRITKGITPPTPKNLKARFKDKGILLSWVSSAGNDLVEGYNLYRNDKLIKTVSNSTSYLDNQINSETTYRYQVSAFSHDKLESEKSETAVIISKAESDDFIQPHDNFNQNSDYCRVCHSISIKELRESKTEDFGEDKVSIYSLCFNCHDGSQATTDILSQYNNQGKYRGHKTKKKGKLEAGTSLPCMVCHDVHASNYQNFAFLSDEVYRKAVTEGYKDPQQDNKVSNDGREMCLICHRGTDNDGLSVVFDIDLGQPPEKTKGHDLGDKKQPCLNCHDNSHNPSPGISEGGQNCNLCHQEIIQVMSEKTRKYVHGFDNQTVKISSSSFDFIKQGSCTNICHIDHPHEQRNYNTHDGTNKNKGENTDSFLCLSCHKETQGTNNAIEPNKYTGSAHDFIPTDGTNFYSGYRGNCVKCHRDNKEWPGSSGPHASDFENLLYASPDNICISCHDQIEKEYQSFSQHKVGKEESAGCNMCHNVHVLKSKLFNEVVTDPFSSNRSALYPFPEESYLEKTNEYDLFCLVCHDGSIKEAADIKSELVNEESIYSHFNNGIENLHLQHRQKGYGCAQCHDVHASNGIIRKEDSIRIGALLRDFIELGASYDAENELYPEKGSCFTNNGQFNYSCHQVNQLSSANKSITSTETITNKQ